MVFFRDSLKEQGVFFKIHDTNEWTLTEEESDEFRGFGKAKKKDLLRYGYRLPKLLMEEDGFKNLFSKIKFVDKVPYIIGMDGQRTSVGSLIKKDLQ